MKTYTDTLKINKETWKRIFKLNGIISFEEEDEDTLKELGAYKDDTSYTMVFQFENGHTITIQQCSGSHNYWFDMWFDDEYDNDEVIDLEEDVYEYVFEFEGTNYECRFIVE